MNGQTLIEMEIGDSPYVIDEYNQDNYPLTNPAQIHEVPLNSTALFKKKMRKCSDWRNM
jgi:hypothetical protein